MSCRHNCLRLYNSYKHGQASTIIARPAHLAETLPLAQLQVPQNSESQIFMLRVKLELHH